MKNKWMYVNDTLTITTQGTFKWLHTMEQQQSFDKYLSANEDLLHQYTII